MEIPGLDPDAEIPVEVLEYGYDQSCFRTRLAPNFVALTLGIAESGDLTHFQDPPTYDRAHSRDSTGIVAINAAGSRRARSNDGAAVREGPG